MLDDALNPALAARRALARVRTWRIGLAAALAVTLGGNIALLLGVSPPESAVAGLRICLGLCFVTAFGGPLLGLFLACLPHRVLPYLYRLPLAAMAGAVLLNVCVALTLGGPSLLRGLDALRLVG